uniref:Hsp90 co-chaperone Cdc37-like 1 n=1 Tax=Periophthalmus magnuspinnatus TaxID=409849 RepID=A0A3B4BJN6_9GOBI
MPYNHILFLLLQQSPSSQLCDSAMASLCQSQQRCVKASVMFGWRLAEAQDQLCSLEVHSSESVQQERARTRACPTELSHTEQELAGSEPSLSQQWFTCCIYFIRPVDQGQETCKTFIQQYEEELKHFGMLHRWDDSQRFLSDMPHLICEETANFLILWCITLQKEGKEALMAQVAHQAVVMQFILEMASNSNQDPRGCFRPFFHKAKEGSNVYQEVFHSELEAFKLRIKDYAFKCKENSINSAGQQRSDPKDSLLSVSYVCMKNVITFVTLFKSSLCYNIRNHNNNNYNKQCVQ